MSKGYFFNIIMRILPIYNYNNKVNNTTHKGCYSTEFISEKYINKGVSDWLVQESSFFRDLHILDFVNNYLKKLNKPIINIISGACSQGFELLSAKMLAEDSGLKVRCLGFDIGEKAVKKANSFKYTILKPCDLITERTSSGCYDSFLGFTKFEEMKPEQKRLKQIFDKQFIIDQQSRKHSMLSQVSNSIEVELKENYRNNILFVQGNMLEMNEFIPEQTADVFFFKNAMYHLTYDENDQPKTRSELKKILEKAASQINRILVPQGLFVLGDLWRDHYAEIGDETYNALKNNGFEPIYQKSIWQKK